MIEVVDGLEQGTDADAAKPFTVIPAGQPG
jgi:hypothetical protein